MTRVQWMSRSTVDHITACTHSDTSALRIATPTCCEEQIKTAYNVRRPFPSRCTGVKPWCRIDATSKHFKAFHTSCLPGILGFPWWWHRISIPMYRFIVQQPATYWNIRLCRDNCAINRSCQHVETETSWLEILRSKGQRSRSRPDQIRSTKAATYASTARRWVLSPLHVGGTSFHMTAYFSTW